MSSALAAARRLAAWWPVEATIAPATGWPTCIQSTRLAVDAFALAGLGELRPLPCKLVTMNAAAVEALTYGRKVPGSCRIEIGPDSAGAKADPEARRGRGRGWWGHLIAEHDEFLLDLVYEGVVVANQAPGFGILGAFCAEKGREVQWLDGTWHAVTSESVYISYTPRPELGGWQDSAAWDGVFEPGLLELVVELLTE